MCYSLGLPFLILFPFYFFLLFICFIFCDFLWVVGTFIRISFWLICCVFEYKSSYSFFDGGYLQ